MDKVVRILITWVAGFIVWAVLGGLLYMNPLIADYFARFVGSPGLQLWRDDTVKYLIYIHIGGLVQVLMYAVVFAVVKDALPMKKLLRGLTFAIIMIVMMVLPRFFIMWIQTTYPEPLLVIDLINGIIMSIGLGLVFAFVMREG
jgi:hypothetical protein